jgi:ABC-2 type transport system permease protein
VRRPAERRLRLSALVLREPFTRDAWSLKGVALAWAVGFSAMLSFLIAVEPTLRAPFEELLDNMGPLARLLAGDVLEPGGLVALMFGTFLAPAVAVFAVLQAGRWANELEEGLLALDLSTPLSRTRVVLSRVGAVLFAAAAALALAWVVALGAAALAGLPLAGAKLAAAAVAALPVALVYFAVGLAVAAWWRPSWGAPVAGALALLDFLYGLLASTLEFPEWSQSLSVFGRYGNPALDGLGLSSHGVLFVVGCGLVALAVAGFRRLDLVW